jgi:hypothetical protein
VAKFGRSDNLVVKSDNFGEQTEVYNGFDFTLNVRRDGMLLSGGISSGQTVTNSCFVVDSPGALRFCEQTVPWSAQTQIKLFGAYPLPWDLQASGTFQSLPGIPIQANYTARNAEIAPTLGRNLAAGASATTSVALIEPNTVFEDRLNQLDLRLTRIFRIGRYRIQGMVDVYNVLNTSTVLAVNTTYGPAWLRPNQIVDGRLFKFGGQVDF